MNAELAKQRKSGNFTAGEDDGKEAAAEGDFMRRRSSTGPEGDDDVDPFMMGGGMSMKV